MVVSLIGMHICVKCNVVTCDSGLSEVQGSELRDRLFASDLAFSTLCNLVWLQDMGRHPKPIEPRSTGETIPLPLDVRCRIFPANNEVSV